MELEIRDLHASVEGKEILKGVNLKVRQGETHALMGPNGSGKSTLAYTLMGHPKYHVSSGDVLIGGESIIGLTPDKRVKKGLFLAFQYPVSVQGVSMFSFLRAAYNAAHTTDPKEPPTIFDFKEAVAEKMKMLSMDDSFLTRYLNEGFSGGEKKRAEILQMALMQPKFSVLDETDSGLDIDALRIVAEGINKVSGPQTGTLLITHYQRILKYVKPQYVHVMYQGRIIESGGEDLSRLLEEKGYTWIKGYGGEEAVPQPAP
ncbi:MAG TPA: Fe-S cluster assembly ATPase SufC [Nitrososphaerales archaeon]|nr:Fe-S cluster assembly ATPase SufC [Nitrososphaerales archaeon]